MDQILLYLSEWIGSIAVAMIAGISPKFKRTKLVFKYPQREGIVALAIFGVAILVSIILNTFPAFQLAGLSKPLSVRLFVAVGGLVPVVVALYRRQQPVRSAGWPRDKLNGALQLGLALAFLVIFLRGKFLAVLTHMTGPEAGMLGLLLIATLCEETVFRGYIQQRLAAWFGPNLGWLAASGLFLLWQLPLLLAVPDQILLNVAVCGAQSLVAGFIMQRSGHALSPAIYRAVSDWLIFVA
jgi:membrane protease YdiL (CAAX protease family)